tara:strand:+ start:11830 stop:12126 length:297 start_codon:yes stop_codon:yes gene_type:complete
MIVKLKEVYRNVSPTASPINKMKYTLRDIFINPEHVIYIRQNPSMSKRLAEGMIDGISTVEEFCTISLSRGQSGTDIIVVGNVEEVNDMLAGKALLHG